MPELLPESVIIIGAGVFGLSTALAIEPRSPSTEITVVDRLTPPVVDGTSVDTTRCIRSDYVDPAYAKLAAIAQDKFRTDPGLAPYYFEQGFAFITDGSPGLFFDLWKGMHANIQQKQDRSSFVDMDDPDQVFQGIHGKDCQSVAETTLGREKQWRFGYTNLKAAVVNAEGCIKAYYDRCCEKPNIKFVCGTPVDRLLYGDDKAVQGVVLEDQRILRADKTIVATGAWSNRLVNLEQQMHARGVEVAYIDLTAQERAKWNKMPIHTNLSTGFNLFPPINGQIKILRRSPGLRNTVSVKDPEDQSKTIEISLPRTTVDSPQDKLAPEMEASLRQELKGIMPMLAARPFARTRFCWLEQTTNGEFLICPHPRLPNLQMATGGSLHGWKFLPSLGDFVVDSMTGALEPELVEKWSWESKETAKHNAYGFMLPGAVREMRDVIGESEKPRVQEPLVSLD